MLKWMSVHSKNGIQSYRGDDSDANAGKKNPKKLKTSTQLRIEIEDKTGQAYNMYNKIILYNDIFAATI